MKHYINLTIVVGNYLVSFRPNPDIRAIPTTIMSYFVGAK